MVRVDLVLCILFVMGEHQRVKKDVTPELYPYHNKWDVKEAL